MRRKFLLSVLLFTIFAVICIYALVRAQGTQINPDGNIVSTSILRITSIPTDVTVYINDQKAVKNENRIEWLQPGQTKVTLKRDGYRDWEKVIELQAGIIEDIYAQLYPETVNFSKITTSNIDNFYFPNNTDYIFYSVINGEKVSENGLWKLKLKRNLLDIGDLLPAKAYSYSEAELAKLQKNPYRIKVTDDATKILIDIPDLKELDYIDLNSPTPVSVNDLLSFYPKDSSWMANSNVLLASNGNLLVTLDLNTRDQRLVYFTPEKDAIYSTVSNRIYYYKFDKSKLYNIIGNQQSEVTFPITYTGNQEISKIFTAKDIPNIFYTLEGTTLNFIDLSKDIALPFASVKEVLSVAPNGRNVIYINSDDEVKALVLEDSLDLKSYDYTINSVNITSTDIINAFYTPSGKNLVVLARNATGGKLIWFMDNDGMNSVQIIDDQILANNTIGIDADGLSLYTLITDKNEISGNTTIDTIYKFNLEAK